MGKSCESCGAYDSPECAFGVGAGECCDMWEARAASEDTPTPYCIGDDPSADVLIARLMRERDAARDDAASLAECCREFDARLARVAIGGAGQTCAICHDTEHEDDCPLHGWEPGK